MHERCHVCNVSSLSMPLSDLQLPDQTRSLITCAQDDLLRIASFWRGTNRYAVDDTRVALVRGDQGASTDIPGLDHTVRRRRRDEVEVG